MDSREAKLKTDSATRLEQVSSSHHATFTLFDVEARKWSRFQRPEIECCTIPDFVVHIVQAAGMRCSIPDDHHNAERTHRFSKTVTLVFTDGSLTLTPNLARAATAAARTVAFSRTTRL